MKSTGVVRKVDGLGRIVIPRELTRIFDIKLNETSMEIYTEGEQIILKKYEPCCVFCGEGTNVLSFKNKNICEHCLKDLQK